MLHTQSPHTVSTHSLHTQSPHTQTQTHRHTDTQTHRHTDTQTYTHTHTHTHSHTHTHVRTLINGHAISDAFTLPGFIVYNEDITSQTILDICYTKLKHGHTIYFNHSNNPRYGYHISWSLLYLFLLMAKSFSISSLFFKFEIKDKQFGIFSINLHLYI